MQAKRNSRPAVDVGRQKSERTRYVGVSKIHARGCGWQEQGDRCSCSPSYQAAVFSVRENKKIRRHFDSLGAAKTWREDAAGAIRQGKMRAPTSTTVAQAAAALIEGMRSGVILDRSGGEYKPSTMRSYEGALRLRILPVIGHRRLASLDRRDVQRLIDECARPGSNRAPCRTRSIRCR